MRVKDINCLIVLCVVMVVILNVSKIDKFIKIDVQFVDFFCKMVCKFQDVVVEFKVVGREDLIEKEEIQ